MRETEDNIHDDKAKTNDIGASHVIIEDAGGRGYAEDLWISAIDVPA